MAAVAVHVADVDVVSTGDSYTIILVDNDTVANLGIIGATQTKSIAVVCCRKAVGAVVGRVSVAIVQRNVVDVQTSAVADTEAVHRIVLDVDVVYGTLSKHLHLNEVVWLGNASVATKAIPPSLTIAIKYGVFFGSDFDIGTCHLDEGIVCIGVLPEGPSFERNLGSSLQLRKIDTRVSRNGDAIEGYASASCDCSRDSGVLRHVAGIGSRSCRG